MKSTSQTTTTFLTLLALLLGNLLLAQSDSFSPPEEKEEEQKFVPNEAANKLMIIPYESRLYRSDIDRAIARKGNMSYFQVRDSIRYGLHSALHAETEMNFGAVSMLSSGDASKIQDLKYIYNSIGYEHRAEKRAAGKQVNMGQVSGGGSKNIKPTQMQMDLRVFNPGLFAHLSDRYDASVFLFVTEFSIDPEPGLTQYDLSHNLYYREARLNYSIYNLEGKNIKSGVETIMIPPTVNELKDLFKEYFPNMAKAVVAQIPKRATKSLD